MFWDTLRIATTASHDDDDEPYNGMLLMSNSLAWKERMAMLLEVVSARDLPNFSDYRITIIANADLSYNSLFH